MGDTLAFLYGPIQTDRAAFSKARSLRVHPSELLLYSGRPGVFPWPPKDYILAVAIGVLLIISLAEYFQVASVQEKVSQLQRQVESIPDTSGQLLQQSQELQQLQGEVSRLSSEVASMSGKVESFQVTDLCVSATTKCQEGPSGAFQVTLANNGTVELPSNTFTVVVTTTANETYAFSSFTLSSPSQLDPGGPAELFVVSSWQDMKNGTGSFSPGEVVQVSICLPSMPCREQNITVQD